MSEIIIVDENDNVIGSKERNEVLKSDFYRATGLIIYNSKGEVLLAQRSFNKKHSPGKWGPAVAGTVEVGETYESNIRKEAKEELGLKDIELDGLIAGPREKTCVENNYFAQLFFLIVNKDETEFTIQKDEVEGVRWFAKSALADEVKNHPEKFITSMPQRVKYILNQENNEK